MEHECPSFLLLLLRNAEFAIGTEDGTDGARSLFIFLAVVLFSVQFCCSAGRNGVPYRVLLVTEFSARRQQVGGQ